MFNKGDNYMEKKIINYLLENRKGTLNEISEETNIEQKKCQIFLKNLWKKE